MSCHFWKLEFFVSCHVNVADIICAICATTTSGVIGSPEDFDLIISRNEGQFCLLSNFIDHIIHVVYLYHVVDNYIMTSRFCNKVQ